MTTIDLPISKREELEHLLAPLERRQVTTDREAMLARREGANLMNELNRIQGR